MKSIHKILLTLSFLFFAFSLTSCGNKTETKDLLQIVKERGKLIVGVKYDSKPFGFIDEENKLKGFDIDLSKAIAKRLLGDENKVEFKQVTSSNRIFLVTAGDVDMAAATMTINSKRAQIIDFSIPYYIAGQALMVFEDSDVKSVRDLKDKKVIVVLGSTSEKKIRELAPTAFIQGFRTYDEAFLALKTKRGDVLTTDDTIIAGLIAENEGFKMLRGRYTREPYGIGFKKNISTKAFQQEVNRILNVLRVDGTLDNLAEKWMK